MNSMNTERLSLASRMQSGEFLTIVQLHPPTPERFDAFSETVDRLEEECGITVFDVNASPDPKRMDSFDVASRISCDGRIVIPHATARDPLEKTLQQANKGYEEHNINHILVVRGDPPKEGNFQTDVETIINSLAAIQTTEGKKKFVLAGGAGHNAKNLDAEAARLKTAADQGVDIFMSQLVLDTEQAGKLHKFSKKPLIAGISALKKIGNNIKGVVVPEAIRDEEDKIGDNAELLYQRRLKRAVDIVRFIKLNKLAQGIYVAAPITLNEEGSEQIVNFMNELGNI